METFVLVLADLLLALGAALRLTRFIVSDDVPGTWWVKWPLDNLKHGYQRKHGGREPGWARYLEGLGCPYCVSVWMSSAVVLTLALAGGPGDAADWWRWIAGFLTLAWLTGHIAARVGDTEE